MIFKELDSFKLSDAISFHDELNPNLWDGQELRPEVKDQLLLIAKDFLEELGVNDLDVKDITVSGSNAAYSYTPHSDLDLHILVDMSKMDNDEIYKELFHAKKTIYNDTHNITIHGVPVELYVQDAIEPVVSIGEYSILHDKWLRIPTKRRANLDQTATKQKYEKLLNIVKRTLQSKNIIQVNKVIQKIKQYRKAGLDKGGEFGPKNLAYKILRKQGLITKLYQLRDKLHSEKLTIEEENPLLNKPTPSIRQVASKHGVSFTDIMDQLVKGVNVELEHTNDEDTAREIALDHLSEDPNYYDKLAKVGLEEAKVPSVRQQILDAVKKNGGSINDYFIRFTHTDKLGFSDKQMFKYMADADDPKFDVDELGYRSGHRALWFYPLSYYLNDKYGTYATDLPYAWLVKLKPNAWLQTVNHGDKQVQQAPQGKQRVGMLRMSRPPAAIFFTHGFDVIGRYYDYAGQHKRHGEVKGRPAPSFFDKIRGLDEDYSGAVTEASGYIPSEKEKNDPRFKTALTVDVHPNTMKKDANKFGNKISRAGIPPTLQPSGKF